MPRSYHVATYSESEHEQIRVTSSQHEIRLRTESQLAKKDRNNICLRLELGDGPRDLRLTNLGPVAVEHNGRQIETDDGINASMPIRITWNGGAIVAFVPDDRANPHRAKVITGDVDSMLSPISVTTPDHSPSPQTLMNWFKAIAGIQRFAASSPEFRTEAVRAVVDPGGLDAGLLLEREGDGWQIACSYVALPPIGISFEPCIADAVTRQRKTLVFQSAPGTDSRLSANETAVFAAPVFDENMEVVAVVYGSRSYCKSNRRRRIRNLEALWIQLVAEAVTAGVMRLSKEAMAAKHQVLLERVFPVDVVRHLSNKDTIDLPADDREVTLLFGDLVDSSALCEGQAPQLICSYFSDVLELMTSAVRTYDGVVVDYYGDGLIAMWNAPVDQANHATLACRAGLAIQRQLDDLNTRWQYRLGQTCNFGIGIHTGRAIVGNSGTTQQLKYGPRGFTVNVTNRIEKATRRLNQTLLISNATRELLPRDATSHRLGQFRLKGIEQPIVLYSLHSVDSSRDANDCCVTKHREIVRLVEKGSYSDAADHLDCCDGCAFDELSLGFLCNRLQNLSRECRVDELVDDLEPIFDLTE